MSGVITDDIHAYMSRDWDAVRRWKDEYWAERIARREDLAAHEQLSEKFRRAAAVSHR